MTAHRFAAEAVWLLMVTAALADTQPGQPILRLSFDDPKALARDLSGWENHGAAHGGLTWIETGVTGGAIRLDGVDDYIT